MVFVFAQAGWPSELYSAFLTRARNTCQLTNNSVARFGGAAVATENLPPIFEARLDISQGASELHPATLANHIGHSSDPMCLKLLEPLLPSPRHQDVLREPLVQLKSV